MKGPTTPKINVKNVLTEAPNREERHWKNIYIDGYILATRYGWNVREKEITDWDFLPPPSRFKTDREDWRISSGAEYF